MKKRELNETIKVNGFYIHEVNLGFFGERNEGKRMLKEMGLPTDTVPFSTSTFLRKRKIFWRDCSGYIVCICFIIKPNQIECFGSYLGKRKSIRMFREWSSCDSPEKVARLESEAIGDLCMRCIYDPLFDLKTVT
ncbi:MAG: hypothetical protein NC453_28945 [Muribaculum sp.]|nr:hypothetical protein [Muribaculum sp.]